MGASNKVASVPRICENAAMSVSVGCGSEMRSSLRVLNVSSETLVPPDQSQCVWRIWMCKVVGENSTGIST